MDGGHLVADFGYRGCSFVEAKEVSASEIMASFSRGCDVVILGITPRAARAFFYSRKEAEMMQSRTRRWALVLVWAALIGVATELGLQKVQGLPACTVCPCKYVVHWWGPNGPYYGTKVLDSTTDLLDAIPNIQTITNSCDPPKFQANNGTCDWWQYNIADYVCTPANPVLSEISIMGSGARTNRGQFRNDCVPNPTGGGT